MVDFSTPLDELAAETSALLQQAGVELAVAETGTQGELARRVLATEEGRACLTQQRIYWTPAELATGLRVSEAKVGAFGALSAMVAAEAAAELIDTYEGGWGLVVVAPAGNSAEVPDVSSENQAAGQGVVALGTPSTTIIQQCPPDHIVRTAFELLREQALRRLALRRAEHPA